MKIRKVIKKLNEADETPATPLDLINQVNAFIANSYNTIKKNFKEELPKSAPGLIAAQKDSQAIGNAEATAASTAFNKFVNAETKADDSKSIEEAIKGFSEVINAVCAYAKVVAEAGIKDAEEKQKAVDDAAKNAENASMDFSTFGNKLNENLQKSYKLDRLFNSYLTF